MSRPMVRPFHPSQRRLWALVVAVAAAVLLGVGVYVLTAAGAKAIASPRSAAPVREGQPDGSRWPSAQATLRKHFSLFRQASRRRARISGAANLDPATNIPPNMIQRLGLKMDQAR